MSSNSEELVTLLPYLRRYARALTGAQERGDRYVRLFLEVILQEPARLSRDGDLKQNMFKAFHETWDAVAVEDEGADAAEVSGKAKLEQRIASLPARHRQVLLLVSLEGFPVTKAAEILGISEQEARQDLLAARLELQKEAGAKVLIIEDETVIAMDIAVTVRSAGHTVVGVGATFKEAVGLAEEHLPDLVLADIHLKGGDSGIDAVEKILRGMTVPVIFITGFPEALLTGKKVEPAFVITKPFDPETLTAAIGQALSFNPDGRKGKEKPGAQKHA
ncbi:MAG: response regulator [Alphaproteobacteria bacterium]